MSKISTSISNDFCPQTLFLYGTNKEDGTPDFGLFCWFSYYFDSEVGVMMCIGGEKLTKSRIKETKIFSANLVTEELLPLADYLGCTDGNKKEKMNVPIELERGAILDVPVLKKSPVVFELEVNRSFPLYDGEVFLCKIRNVLMEESLKNDSVSIEERIRTIAPICTTCSTYFSFQGKALGGWGEPQNELKR